MADTGWKSLVRSPGPAHGAASTRVAVNGSSPRHRLPARSVKQREDPRYCYRHSNSPSNSYRLLQLHHCWHHPRHRSTRKPPHQGQGAQRRWGAHPVWAHVLWPVPSPGDPQPRTLLLPAGAVVSGTHRWGWRQTDSSKHPADPVAVFLPWVAPAHPARSNPCPQGLGRVSLGGQPGRASPS